MYEKHEKEQEDQKKWKGKRGKGDTRGRKEAREVSTKGLN